MELLEEPGSVGLRSKKKAATQAALREAASRLFAERGFAAVSVDEIASEAQVSRSTFFRYFGSKEAVLFQEFDEAGELFVEKLRARPPGETPWEAFMEAMVETTTETGSDARRAENRILDNLLRNDPALSGRRFQEMERWIDTVAGIFAERGGRTEPNFADRLAASTCMAVTEEVGRVWRETEAAKVADAVRRAFEVLRTF